MEFKYLSFQAWKVMELNCWTWKVMENYGMCWYVNYCRCRSKGKIKYRQDVRKYPENKVDFDNFRKWQLNFRSCKLEKVMKKVMESHGI